MRNDKYTWTCDKCGTVEVRETGPEFPYLWRRVRLDIQGFNQAPNTFYDICKDCGSDIGYGGGPSKKMQRLFTWLFDKRLARAPAKDGE